MYDYLIVGAGFFGSVFAEQVKHSGKKILVIDQRNHIGGNCYTEDVDGIQVHKYGPHIFHTHSLKVWNYIRKFADFNHYTHRVKVNNKGRIFSFPINLLTLHQLWGIAEPSQVQEILKQKIHNIPHPKNMEEWCLANLGDEIYETFFKGYTTKQWRRAPSELPATIIKRLPVRFKYEDNYFDDAYQGIPIGGYTQIFDRMLSGVEVKLNTPLEPDWRRYAKKLIYSGRPDTLLDYKYGELPYLTMRFESERLEGDYQGVAQMNYTAPDVPWTRSVEHKHFEFKEHKHTIVTHEYPEDWHTNATPYYPVPSEQNTDIHQKYMHDIKQLGDIFVGGRLGRFAYFDMHQVIASALHAAEEELRCL